MAFGIDPNTLALRPSTVLQDIIQRKQLAAREKEVAIQEKLALKRIALSEQAQAEQARQFGVSQAEQARQFEIGRTEMTPYQKEVTDRWGEMTEAQKIDAKIKIAAEKRAADVYKQEQDWRKEPEPTIQPTVQPTTQPKILQQTGYEDLADQWNLADSEVKRFLKLTPKAGYKRKEWLALEKTRKSNLINAKEAKISARTAAITRKRQEPRLSIVQEIAVNQQRNQALSVINTGTIEEKDEAGTTVVRPIKNRAEMKNTILALGIDIDTDSKLRAALDKKFPAYKEVDQAIEQMFKRETGGDKLLTAEEIAEEITFINANQDLKANEKKTLVKKIQSKQIKIETRLKVPSSQRLGKMIRKLNPRLTKAEMVVILGGSLLGPVGLGLGMSAVAAKRFNDRFGAKMGSNLMEFMKGLAGE